LHAVRAAPQSAQGIEDGSSVALVLDSDPNVVSELIGQVAGLPLADGEYPPSELTQLGQPLVTARSEVRQGLSVCGHAFVELFKACDARVELKVLLDLGLAVFTRYLSNGSVEVRSARLKALMPLTLELV
jgi:hypothetical protein